MAITTVGEMFDRAADFECRLELFYASIRDRSNDSGVRLLTYYLSRHRHHLAEVLKDYSPALVDKIRKIELKYDVPFTPAQKFHAINIAPAEIKGQQLLQAALEYDQALVEMYKTVLEQPLIEQAMDIFESLVRVEEREIVMLKKMLAMDYF